MALSFTGSEFYATKLFPEPPDDRFEYARNK
jgi:hypothetical protein